jgi:hypothetical protein
MPNQQSRYHQQATVTSQKASTAVGEDEDEDEDEDSNNS